MTPPDGEHEHVSEITSKAGWADAATYTVSDINMLRRELVLGYVIAGFLTVLVPMEWWNSLFMQGHGFWTTLENAIIGPLIAVISFVCSIGNVPMAAALWHGGIGFAGVISFIFADLITFPLLLIYKKYYGLKLTLRLFFTFWAVMSLAGLLVEGIFALFGAVPTDRPEAIVPEHITWNYTTVLNIVFLGVLAVVFWLARHAAGVPVPIGSRSIRCAACRSRRRTRPPALLTTVPMSTSVATTAATYSCVITRPPE